MSRVAEQKLNVLFDILVLNWSVKVKNDFVAKLDHAISIIRNQPESFPASSKEKNIRKCVITKQTTLFYRFDNEEINILTIFDTRQDPNKLKRDF